VPQFADFENGSIIFQSPSRKLVTVYVETRLGSYNLTTLYQLFKLLIVYSTIVWMITSPELLPMQWQTFKKGGTHASLSGILESGKHFVLATRCDDRVFTPHQAVICFFAAACNWPFHVSDGSATRRD
jgi:hypothetical protein